MACLPPEVRRVSDGRLALHALNYVWRDGDGRARFGLQRRESGRSDAKWVPNENREPALVSARLLREYSERLIAVVGRAGTKRLRRRNHVEPARFCDGL